MKIVRIGEPKIIMCNPQSAYPYFAWPSVARLRDGRIAVGASGFRKRHICPYGKAVVSYSSDEGETYTPPVPVIDTSLDDRDCGITPFGEDGMIVTSFNNTVDFQLRSATEEDRCHLANITPEMEARDIGATFRISHDGGKSFGPIYKSPITSPHGPIPLSDGSVLWLGRTFSPVNDRREDDCLKAYRVFANGSMEYRGTIENIVRDGRLPLLCEPHAIQLEDGRILAHIRVQDYAGGQQLFTTYQSESFDMGRTWTKPVQILSDAGGAPAHLLRHSSGLLISSYGFRGEPLSSPPFGIRVIFSKDNGAHWSEYHDLYVNHHSGDLGYPATVELFDGSLLTVFYALPAPGEPAVILQQKWRIED